MHRVLAECLDAVNKLYDTIQWCSHLVWNNRVRVFHILVAVLELLTRNELWSVSQVDDISARMLQDLYQNESLFSRLISDWWLLWKIDDCVKVHQIVCLDYGRFPGCPHFRCKLHNFFIDLVENLLLVGLKFFILFSHMTSRWSNSLSLCEDSWSCLVYEENLIVNLWPDDDTFLLPVHDQLISLDFFICLRQVLDRISQSSSEADEYHVRASQDDNLVYPCSVWLSIDERKHNIQYKNCAQVKTNPVWKCIVIERTCQ